MINPRLSVDAMCSFPWSFERDLAFWQDMGVRHAGVLWHKIEEDPAGRLAKLGEAGITASTIITECFDLAAPESWEKTRAVQCAAIDLAARYGGRSIYFTPGRSTCATWSDDLERLAKAVAPVVSYARARDVRAAIEPSLRTSVSFVNTLRDAVDVAERTGLALIADFGNMWMERDLRDVIALAMPHVALVQIADVVIGSSNKPPPGGRAHIFEGELPLRRMMQDVLDAGYAGVFDLEVVPANFAAGCDDEQLRRGIARASQLLDEVGIG